MVTPSFKSHTLDYSLRYAYLRSVGIHVPQLLQTMLIGY